MAKKKKKLPLDEELGESAPDNEVDEGEEDTSPTVKKGKNGYQAMMGKDQISMKGLSKAGAARRAGRAAAYMKRGFKC